MINYNTFAETEALLLTAIELPGRSIMEIVEATGIKPNTLYKWKSSSKGHLSSSKADRLLLYFVKNEPKHLEFADLLQSGTSLQYYKDRLIFLYPLSFNQKIAFLPIAFQDRIDRHTQVKHPDKAKNKELRSHEPTAFMDRVSSWSG